MYVYVPGSTRPTFSITHIVPKIVNNIAHCNNEHLSLRNEKAKNGYYCFICINFTLIFILYLQTFTPLIIAFTICPHLYPLACAWPDK